MKKITFSDKFGLTEAVLSGRKTMTRRIVPQSTIDKYALLEDPTIIDDARYNVGEVVAIAQAYKDFMEADKVLYRTVKEVDGYRRELASEQKGWNNKLFVCANLMPHHIRITDVKVERLQDISDEDFFKEGIYPFYYDETRKECGFAPDGFSFDGIDCHYPTSREAFASLIDRVSGKGVWQSNPWVFAYEFELVD